MRHENWNCVDKAKAHSERLSLWSVMIMAQELYGHALTDEMASVSAQRRLLDMKTTMRVQLRLVSIFVGSLPK